MFRQNVPNVVRQKAALRATTNIASSRRGSRNSARTRESCESPLPKAWQQAKSGFKCHCWCCWDWSARAVEQYSQQVSRMTRKLLSSAFIWLPLLLLFGPPLSAILCLAVASGHLNRSRLMITAATAIYYHQHHYDHQIRRPHAQIKQWIICK